MGARSFRTVFVTVTVSVVIMSMTTSHAVQHYLPFPESPNATWMLSQGIKADCDWNPAQPNACWVIPTDPNSVCPHVDAQGNRRCLACTHCSSYPKDGWALDITIPGAGDLGYPILASADGIVMVAGCNVEDYEPYGCMVFILHDEDGNIQPNHGETRTLYGHMITLTVGDPMQQTITRGLMIGLLGNTGASHGAHLHYRRDQFSDPDGDGKGHWIGMPPPDLHALNGSVSTLTTTTCAMGSAFLKSLESILRTATALRTSVRTCRRASSALLLLATPPPISLRALFMNTIAPRTSSQKNTEKRRS